MTVLGIDPGLERIGYGLIDRTGSRLVAMDFGLIKTPKGATPARLALIFTQISELVRQTKPDLAVCERLFFTKNQTTGIDVAKALGVIQLVLETHGVVCREMTPTEIKLAVVGHGGADKRQVQYMVTKLLRLDAAPKPDDVADAIAAAIAGALAIRL